MMIRDLDPVPDMRLRRPTDAALQTATNHQNVAQKLEQQGAVVFGAWTRTL